MKSKPNTNWLTDKLKNEIRAIYEPAYKRTLTEQEVIEIAENISDVTETILKFIWRKKYENVRQQ